MFVCVYVYVCEGEGVNLCYVRDAHNGVYKS